MDPFEVFRSILGNEIMKLITIYYVISTIVWSLFLFLLNKRRAKNFDNFAQQKSSIKYTYLAYFICIIAVTFLLLMALNYVGYLPYGPDTSGYTFAVKNISTTGFWRGSSESYYGPYHTSAVLLAITTQFVGSVQLAYSLILIGLLVSFLLLAGNVVSKMVAKDVTWIGVVVVSALFIATPNIGGFDLLQQYVSLVCATIAVFLLFRSVNFARKDIVLFLPLVTISVITHLTSVLLSLTLLAAFIFYRKRLFKFGFLIFYFVATVYLFCFVRPDNIILSLYNFLKSLIYGTHEFTVRALTEEPTAVISLLSWVLLPSLALAHFIVFILTKFTKRLKSHGITIANDNSRIKRFILTSSALALGLMFIGVISRTTGAEIIRYVANPSYIILLMMVSLSLCHLFAKNKNRLFTLLIFLSLLAPYIYSALNSEGRSPWMGEVRLSPVTYADRLEMLILAKYGADGYYIYQWHDIYIPLEDVEKPPHFIGGSVSYYPIHEILIKASRDEKVEVPVNSYLIIHKDAIKTVNFKNYNIIFDGNEHKVFMPKT
jgi:hypothetical protein